MAVSFFCMEVLHGVDFVFKEINSRDASVNLSGSNWSQGNATSRNEIKKMILPFVYLRLSFSLCNLARKSIYYTLSYTYLNSI